MTKTIVPMWLFVAVALAMASIAFWLAQIVSGAGTMFVAAATPLWVAYVVRHRGGAKTNG